MIVRGGRTGRRLCLLLLTPLFISRMMISIMNARWMKISITIILPPMTIYPPIPSMDRESRPIGQIVLAQAELSIISMMELMSIQTTSLIEKRAGSLRITVSIRSISPSTIILSLVVIRYLPSTPLWLIPPSIRQKKQRRIPGSIRLR